MFSRRAQEEAVGFVAIVVIVALAAVFFIGLQIRHQAPEALGSANVKQFLESTRAYTTTCDLGLKNKYASLEEVLKACVRNNQQNCLNGGQVCKVYNETTQRLLSAAWNIGPEQAIKGYSWNVSYDRNTGSNLIVSFTNGTCSGSYRAEELLSPDTFSGGTFVTSAKICY